MPDSFGATADPNYGYSPYSGQTHYGSYPPSTLPFSAPPGPGNPATVEQISQRIRNLHPEQMAALADQWQNAWSFLADVRDFVYRQSVVLRDESWQSPGARDAFLKMGPGVTLAYLDVWMEAAQKNVVALRHLVTVSTEARHQMELLLRDYQEELKQAREIGFLENLGAFVSEGVSWDAAAQEKIEEDQGRVAAKYRLEAQRLAQHYGDQFFDYIAVVSSGVGPPVQPLNAVLADPGGIPGTGGGTGNGPGLAPTPVGNTPPGLPPGQNPPQGLLPPGVQLPAPQQPGAVPPPGVLPPGATPPGALPPGVSPPGLPPGALPPAVVPPGALPPGTLPPGTLPPGAVPLPPGQTVPVPGTPPGGTVIPPVVRPTLPPQVVPGGRGPVAVPPGTLPPGRTIRRPSGPSAPVVPPPGGRQIGRPAPTVVPPAGPRPGTTGRPGRTTPGVTPPGTLPPQSGRPGRTTPGVTPPGTLPPQSGRPGRTTPGAVPPQGGRPGRTTPGVTPPGTLPPQGGRPGGTTPGVTPPSQNGRAGRTTPVPVRTTAGIVPPLPGRPGTNPGGGGADPGRPGATPGRPGGSPGPSGAGTAGTSPGRPGTGISGTTSGATGIGAAGTTPGRPGTGFPGGTPLGPQTGQGGNGRGGDGRDAQPGAPNRVPDAPAGPGAFSRPPAAPPVLRNPVDDRDARPGSAAEVRPQGGGDRPGGTAPPVLNRPTSPAAPPPWRPERRERPGAAWNDLFGESPARPSANGVVGAPERARPDSGPWGLRSPAAEPGRPGTVTPELGRRRGGGEPIPVREEHDPISDEHAFGVRSPGGGVVTGRPDSGDPWSEDDIPRPFRR